MAVNITEYYNLIKQRWSPEKVEEMSLKAAMSPLYTMLAKKGDWGGEAFYETVIYAGVRGRSKKFSVAQANKQGTKQERFANERVHDYALISIDNETIEASQGSENALVAATKSQIDSAVITLSNQFCVDLYRDGSGSIGEISSISSGVVTFTRSGDAKYFDNSMRIVAAADAATDPRAAVGTVSAVDVDAGTATFNSGVDPTGWIAGDLLFVEGDYEAANDQLAISGLAAWLPSSTATLSTAFKSVTRSKHPTKLAGHRENATGLRPEIAMYNLATRIAENNGRPSCVTCSYNIYAQVSKNLGSKVEYETTEMTGGIGFAGIKLHGTGKAGDLMVYPDTFCPDDKAYVLTPETFKIRSLGKLPRFMGLGGAKGRDEATADAVEWRLGYYGNLTCKAPGWNGVVYNLQTA